MHNAIEAEAVGLMLVETVGFMSVFAVNAFTKVCKTEEEMFYAKLKSVLIQCPCHNALIVLGDFNAFICCPPRLWNQEQQQLFPSVSCKIQKAGN